MDTKTTVGAAALNLAQKTAGEAYAPVELQQEIHKGDSGITGLLECVERGKKENDSDFFIVCITKKERLLQNVIRTYYLHRKTCPTPSWDEAVYRYNRKDDSVEFLWVIPDKQTCELMISLPDQIPLDHAQLQSYVVQMYNGDLFERSKRLNGEQSGSILLEKGV